MRMQIPYKIADPGFVIAQIQQLYSSPHLAFKEYLSNSLDNRIFDEKLSVNIEVSKTNRAIIIKDNGAGMSIEDLAKIPANIGLSASRGIEYAIGEKGFGMLAYPSCGAHQCQVYSKRENSDEDLFNFLLMEQGKSEAVVDQVPQKDLKKFLPIDIPIRDFNHGTFVILHGIPEDWIKRYFSPTSIRNLVSTIYAPLIRKRELNVLVGYHGRGKKFLTVDPPIYRGESILDGTMPVEFQKGKETKRGEIEIYLFINPEGTNERVGYFNKGVLVMDSIAKLDELNNLPWKSGKLNGEINENFLTLNAPREAPVRQGRRYPLFIETVKTLEDDLKDEIGRLKEKTRKTKYEDWASQFLRVIDAVWGDLKDKYPVLVLGTSKDETKKVKRDQRNGGRTRIGGERDKPTERPGRDTFKEDRYGEERPIRRARKLLSTHYRPSFERFGIEEQDLRSKLDEEYGLVRINIDHKNYRHSEEQKDDKVMKRYIAALMSKEISFGEFNRFVEGGALNPKIPEHLHKLTEMYADLYQNGIRLMKIE